MRFPVIIAALFLLTVACSPSLRQRQVSPVAPLPENWTAMTLSDSLSSVSWWESFSDPQLDSLLAEAYRANYTLQIAAANVEAAIARARVAGAPRLPQLNAVASGSRRKQNFIGLPIPSAGGDVITRQNNTFGVSLDLSWEIDLWGRLRAGHIAAIADRQAASADFIGARLSLAGQVSKVWFAAIEARRQLELAEATAENYETSLKQVQQRYESGVRSSLDLRRSRANLATARATLSLRRSQYESTVRQLEILLGRYPSAALAVAPEMPRVAEQIPSGLPASLVIRRPDLVAAERRLVARDASAAAARRALLPSISLTGSSGTSTNELKEILNGDFSIWSIAGNILQPLFQGGRLRANLKLANSQADIAEANYLLTTLTALGEVESALANERYLGDREAALAEAVAEANAARDLAESQYQRGVGDFLIMLDAQRTAYQTESQYLSARRERLAARVDLHLALGGGFQK